MMLPSDRRRSPWRALAVLGLAFACNGALATIGVTHTDEAVIQGGGLVGELLGQLGFDELQSLDFEASEELRNEGVERGDIDGVYLRSFVLTVIEPSDADLAFLERLEIYTEAPGLERVLIASGDAFSAGEQKASLAVEDLDLTAYAVAEHMTLAVHVQGRQLARNVRLRAEVTFDVGVTLQGACNAARAN